MEDASLIDLVLGSNIPYITYSVPIFFVLIAIELVAGLIQRKRLYNYSDSISDLSCGILSQMTGVFIQGLTFGAYVWLWKSFGVLDIEGMGPAGKWVAAAALFLGVDFFYYWFHRMSHEVNFLWAAHMVHHQSEEYNLSVALRQSTFQGWFSWTFYLPLALIGFPPVWFASMNALNILYQFWVHTCAIDRLGPLEAVLNTPSHHRVHHGKNPQYIDRNHAGTLIIWDKLFGTFEPEGEPVVYGTTRELKSFNPVWANFAEWQAIYQEGKAFPRWQDRLKLWFEEPGWRPEGMPPEPKLPRPSVETQIKYRAPISRGMIAYTTAHFALTLVAAVAVLLFNGSLGLLAVAPIALWVILGLMGLGALTELKSWGRSFELARLASGVVLAAYYLQGAEGYGVMMAVLGAVAIVSAALQLRLTSHRAVMALAPSSQGG